MKHSIAIAARRPDAFSMALASARNTLLLLVNFMYGTPERVRATYMFAFGLAIMGGLMFGNTPQQVCTF